MLRFVVCYRYKISHACYRYCADFRHAPPIQLIEAEWRIYASVNFPSLAQIMARRRQSIIWTNDGNLLIRPLCTNFSEILIEFLTFIRENAFENVVRNVAGIMSSPQFVNASLFSDMSLICFLIWVIHILNGNLIG